MCASNGKCVEGEVEILKISLKSKTIRKRCHVKYTLHVTALVIVFHTMIWMHLCQWRVSV